MNKLSFFQEILQIKPITEGHLSRKHIWFVLSIAALCGFFISAVGCFHWQTVVDSGQVVAGLVHLPKDNPGYLYHVNVYSLLIQISALLFRLGLSEKVISFIFSGLEMMLSFAALSACVLALSRKPLLSLVSPFMSLYLGAYQYGHDYAVFILSGFPTYGIVGLALLFLCFCLFALGERKIAAFLLGILPAIHLTLGLFGWLIIGTTLLLESRRFRQQIPQIFKFFLIGASLFALSYCFHRFFTQYLPDFPHYLSNLISKYYSLYMRNVSETKIPSDFLSEPFFVALSSVALSLVWLLFFKKDLSEAACFILYAFIFCFIIGLIYSVMFYFFQDLLPTWVMVVLPNRLMNINSLGYFPLILGLLGLYSDYLPFLIILLFFLLQIPLLLLWKGAAGVGHCPTEAFYFMTLASIALILTRIIFKKVLSRGKTINQHIRLLMCRISSLVIISMLLSLAYAYKTRYAKGILLERSEQSFFSSVGRRPGLLLTAPTLGLIQIRTRRPVLLDMDSLDMARYVKEVGPGMNEILKKIYGFGDFFIPVSDDDYDKSIENTKVIWKNRTLNEWRKIREEFSVTDIIVPGDWELNLPEVMQSPTKEYKLYHIPLEAK